MAITVEKDGCKITIESEADIDTAVKLLARLPLAIKFLSSVVPKPVGTDTNRELSKDPVKQFLDSNGPSTLKEIHSAVGGNKSTLFAALRDNPETFEIFPAESNGGIKSPKRWGVRERHNGQILRAV
jgi:hypothetical protein